MKTLKSSYIIEADFKSISLETPSISSFTVASKVYNNWKRDEEITNVRLMKDSGQGRVHIEI